MSTTAHPVQSSDPSSVVSTRRLSFDARLRDLPRHFAADGDLVSSHMMAALSSIFPHGEEYFVRSVRHFRDRIVDPALRQQVAGFIGQEAMHGRSHMVLNERLAQLGYPTSRMSRWADRIFRAVERRATPEINLAVTAGYEHFTATLAEWLMRDPDYLETLGHPAIQEIFLWHALEESEHKSVAFDVYRAVGGSERQRIQVMRVLLVAIPAVNLAFCAASLLGDRDTYRPRVLWKSLRLFASGPLSSKEYRDMLAEYLRPGFHPTDRDTSALTEQLREQLFGDEGQMVGLLVGGSNSGDGEVQSTS